MKRTLIQRLGLLGVVSLLSYTVIDPKTTARAEVYTYEADDLDH